MEYEIMLGIILGIAVIVLGLKGFTQNGLPLTRSRQLTGRAAKSIGSMCVLIGLIFIGDGIYSMGQMLARLSEKDKSRRDPLSRPPDPPGFDKDNAVATLAWYGKEVIRIRKAAPTTGKGNGWPAGGEIDRYTSALTKQRIRWVLPLASLEPDGMCRVVSPTWDAPDPVPGEIEEQFVFKFNREEAPSLDDDRLPVMADVLEWLRDQPANEPILLTAETSSGVLCNWKIKTVNGRSVRTNIITLGVKNVIIFRPQLR